MIGEYDEDDEDNDAKTIITISFDYRGDSVSRSSMFIGTSPAFEFALYTYLYLARDPASPEEVDFGDFVVDILIHRDDNGRLAMAYPVEQDD